MTVALFTLLARRGVAQTPGVYTVDPQSSRIEIHVFRGGFLAGLGDNHQIVLNQFSATAQGLDGKSWEVHVKGEAGSLQVVDPGTSESTRQEVQKIMLGATQLDVQRYPTIELRMLSLARGDAERSLGMVAELTLHGVTRQVEFPIAWTQDAGRLRVQGKKPLLLRDFKIEPIRKALGSVQVRNEFEVVYDLTLVPESLGRSR